LPYRRRSARHCARRRCRRHAMPRHAAVCYAFAQRFRSDAAASMLLRH
jgi:hypothetical protein